jgi:hypothetical protein
MHSNGPLHGQGPIFVGDSTRTSGRIAANWIFADDKIRLPFWLIYHDLVLYENILRSRILSFCSGYAALVSQQVTGERAGSIGSELPTGFKGGE